MTADLLLAPALISATVLLATAINWAAEVHTHRIRTFVGTAAATLASRVSLETVGVAIAAISIYAETTRHTAQTVVTSRKPNHNEEERQVAW